MFQFPRFPSTGLYIQPETLLVRNSWFPYSDILGYNACTRLPGGLSQCPTSFIGTWRQGIHHKLLVASPRDTEKLILFALLITSINFFIGLHHLAIQFLRFISLLTSDRCSRSQSRASITLQLILDTKRPDVTPPGH